jgi:LytS/YehU family sensor histidine kinase
MSLQMLVENAIKHNEVSAEFPLHVTITSSLNNMIVSNNLQKRKLNEESTKTGLKNIEARYKYFTDQPILIEESDHSFTVSIPLIQQA